MQGHSQIQYFQMHQWIPGTHPDMSWKEKWLLHLDLSKTSAAAVLAVWWPKRSITKGNILNSVVQENNHISKLQKAEFFLV